MTHGDESPVPNMTLEQLQLLQVYLVSVVDTIAGRHGGRYDRHDKHNQCRDTGRMGIFADDRYLVDSRGTCGYRPLSNRKLKFGGFMCQLVSRLPLCKVVSLLLAMTLSAFAAATDVPAGAYRLDKSHASLIFRVDHLGFSNYTARFTRFDAELTFDPEAPEAAHVSATVDTSSLETDFPNPEVIDFNAMLQDETWLDTETHPQMTYHSTRIEMTGEKTARIHGDLTLRGVTRPVVLTATFNGGYAGHPMDPQARIGFSATGSLQRSEFGMTYGIPEPGSSMGVSDRVEIIIEAEFSGPPLEVE